MARLRRALALLSTILVPSLWLELQAQVPAPFEDWFKADHVVVRTAVPGMSGFSRTEVRMAPSGDCIISVESTDSQHTQNGTILLVSGNWMATKNLKLERGYEVDAIDAPVLEVQLALQLLARAVPRGPGAVVGRQTLNTQEKNNPINVSTSSAEETYGVPWKLAAFVQRQRPELVDFDVAFTFTAEKSDQRLHLVRSAEKLAKPFQLANTFSLNGWNVLRLGPYTEATTRGTIAEYGARPVVRKFRTVGHLRKFAAKQ